MPGKQYHTQVHQSSLCVLRVPLDRFPALNGVLWRTGDGKARSPTPWFRQNGCLCYVYKLPSDVTLDLPLERDGVRLDPFDPERDLDQVWGLPPDGFGPLRTIWKPKLHPRPPITLPMAVLRWLLGQSKAPQIPSKDQGRDKGPSPSPEGISGPYSGPKTPPPPVRSIFEILRADEGVARFIYERLGGQRWRRNATLRLDDHKVVFTFRQRNVVGALLRHRGMAFTRQTCPPALSGRAKRRSCTGLGRPRCRPPCPDHGSRCPKCHPSPNRTA